MEPSPPTTLPEPTSPLPYTDVKPVGAADFYTAVNATFRFIHHKLGTEGLRRYWTELGRDYYAPVTRNWQAGGLTAVADYWRAFFAAEPGADVTVSATSEEVAVQVRTCPAIKFLRDHNREVVPCFCQHCYHVSTAMGEPAGMEVRIRGGNGTCTQRFARTGHFTEPQREEEIATAS